jgi:hypothetical protein
MAPRAPIGWLLLKNPEHLDPVKGEPRRLQEALRLNEPLATACYLKEDLRQIWEQPGTFPARIKLLDWSHQTMASGIGILQEFAKTLLIHSAGILAENGVDGRACPRDRINGREHESIAQGGGSARTIRPRS